MAIPEKERRIKQFEQVYREHGLPVTVQRRAVFEAVLERADHPSADQVYQAVHGELPQISRMTVYRILANLVSFGLLTRICHPDSVARFDPKLCQHHHLVCQECGSVIDLEESQLNSVVWPDVSQHGFEIEDYQIHFRGRCSRCRRTPRIKVATPKPGTRPRDPRMKRK